MVGSVVARPAVRALVLAALLLGGALSCGGGTANTPDAASGPIFGTPSPALSAPPFPTGLVQATCTDASTRDGVGHWKAISLDGAPPRPGTTVWTGSEVVSVDVAQDYAGTVKAYDPVFDSWRDLSPPDPSYLNRKDPFLGVVGGTLVFYGGFRECSGCTSGVTQWLNDGWTIDLASGAWTAMQPGPALVVDVAPASMPVFGAGSKALFIVDNDPNVTAATYDLPSGTWQTASGPADGSEGGGCQRPVWNGQLAICQELLSDTLATVTPDSPTWTPFATLVALPLELPIIEFTPVGDKYLALAVPNLPPYDDFADYLFMVDPVAQTWSELVPVPQAGVDRRVPFLTTVGGRVVIWGGAFSMAATPDIAGEMRNDGIVLDPSTNTWSPLTCLGAPPAPGGFGSIVATGSGFIVFENDVDTGMAGSALLEL